MQFANDVELGGVLNMLKNGVKVQRALHKFLINIDNNMKFSNDQM